MSPDPLWVAEDIEAVLDRDPYRVCTLEGSIAAKNRTLVNESISELLHNIEADLAKRILESFVQGTAYPENPLQRLISPHTPTSVVIKGSAQTYGPHQADFDAVRVVRGASSSLKNAPGHPSRSSSAPCIGLTWASPSSTRSRKVVTPCIMEFYWKLWFGDSETLPLINIRDTFTAPDVTIKQAEIQRFYAAVGNDGESFKSGGRADEVQASIDSPLPPAGSGKSVKVKGAGQRDGQPIVECQAPPPGARLFFHASTDYRFRDKATYPEILITSQIFVRDQLKQLEPVYTVDYRQTVLAFQQRRGVPDAIFSKLENGGYFLTSSKVPSTFLAPAINEPYSKISGDFNPIHINPYFSEYASLPGTTTHGMWSSAAT
ncbi:3-oxoacyl-[acyl-carrier-protein] synthase [Tulasnella sp. 427]|nr:3-oxoacyl-[acyl-carrier-protein] synthase [Tulasnella sp. 427]